ncbi:prion-like-(Q/N-rich) domain-bearing protein 25 isoform X2 [Littorina saxatilis]|uniref:prion-like-(Q/N-rich) domain-bearing protein 25 isoform X2 n=1 Tax=Littorina saxatilis TaxID=31220 RepID=UPI0038B45DED
MATFSFAVVVCIFLLVKGTDAQAAGERCNNKGACDDPTDNGAAILCEEGTSTCKMNAGSPCNTTTPCLVVDTCEDGTCKIRVDGYCYSEPATPNCIAHAECLGNTCLCKKDFTATTENTVCEPVKAEPTGCGDTGPCASDATCEGGTCKTKITTVDEECSATDKACDPTTLACQDKKCKKKIEQPCSATEECVAGAECPSDGVKRCSCTGGLAASPDMTKCGAMGVAASMLLVMATFVTSRFL